MTSGGLYQCKLLLGISIGIYPNNCRLLLGSSYWHPLCFIVKFHADTV